VVEVMGGETVGLGRRRDVEERMREETDVLICGGGPAGAAAAIVAARKGLRVVVIERAEFPRHKVCGDCLNPDCWEVLEVLGVADGVRRLRQGVLRAVRMVSPGGREVVVGLPEGAEVAVRREDLDELLLRAAAAAGAKVYCGEAMTRLAKVEGGWEAGTAERAWRSRVFIAADGRNSTSCRLLRLSPASRRDRVAVQCHAPMAAGHEERVSLEIYGDGYAGIAPVGEGEMNVCAVAAAGDLEGLRRRLMERLGIPEGVEWHRMAPLERADLAASPRAGLFLTGDVARVVEPFTGEGIYYALKSGMLAGQAAVMEMSGNPAGGWYAREHGGMYRRRFWVNRLARVAVTRPWVGSLVIRAGAAFPGLLRWVTSKVVRPLSATGC